MRHQRWAPLVVVIVTALAACGESTGPEGDLEEAQSIHGTYTLESINGLALPYELGTIAGATTLVTAGMITLTENFGYSETRSFEVTEDGIVTDEQDTFTGTYAHSGSEVRITSEQVIYILSLNGRTLTEIAGRLTFVWRR